LTTEYLCAEKRNILYKPNYKWCKFKREKYLLH